jgi:ribosomal protein S18 acetylase RimI-like enzyme
MKALASPSYHRPDLIRPYRTSDRSALIEVFRLNTPKYFDPSELSHFEEYLSKYSQTYFTVEQNGTIVGGAGFHFTKNDTVGHISWIFFHPDFSGKGLGSTAIRHCLDRLKSERKLRRLSATTSQLAYKFFEKFGFRLVRTEKDYWGRGLDLYEMEITLPG